jgi:hypothetical protein
MWVPHLFCRHRYVVGSVPIFSLRASLVRCQYFYVLGIDHAVEGLDMLALLDLVDHRFMRRLWTRTLIAVAATGVP